MQRSIIIGLLIFFLIRISAFADGPGTPPPPPTHGEKGGPISGGNAPVQDAPGIFILLALLWGVRHHYIRKRKRAI